MISIRPIGPGSTSPEVLLAVLDEMRRAILELQNPQGPVPGWPSDSGDLPSATGNDYGQAIATDLDTIVFSDGAVWRRVDTGAPV